MLLFLDSFFSTSDFFLSRIAIKQATEHHSIIITQHETPIGNTQ